MPPTPGHHSMEGSLGTTRYPASIANLKPRDPVHRVPCSLAPRAGSASGARHTSWFESSSIVAALARTSHTATTYRFGSSPGRLPILKNTYTHDPQSMFCRNHKFACAANFVGSGDCDDANDCLALLASEGKKFNVTVEYHTTRTYYPRIPSLTAAKSGPTLETGTARFGWPYNSG